MKRLLVHGAHGRMGRRICALAEADSRFQLVASIGRMDAFAPKDSQPSCDVVIDFSSPEGAVRASEFAVSVGAACLVGTTALLPENIDAMANAARSVPLMIAPNTSLGVAVLNHVAAEAARLLGPSFDIDLVESHHSAKRDAPSGTALRLVEVLQERSGVAVPPERVHAIRAGDIVGEHTLMFAGPGERLELRHMATSRDVFARGALEAAHWLSQVPAGLYRIEHALGLLSPDER